jgi:hypothetical protein
MLGALLACLTACSLTSSGDAGGECATDAQCGDDVCAPNGECVARANVRSVTVKWTIDGSSAAAAACASHRELYLQFDGPDYGDKLRYVPVPCEQGQYRVEKLPKRFEQVEIGFEHGGPGDIATIDATTSAAQLDLTSDLSSRK